MRPFSYATPATPGAALALAAGGGRYLAGGVDLLGEMKEGLAAPDLLVNLKGLPDLDGIALADGHCIIGANTTLVALAEHEGVRRRLPGLAAAAAQVGSPQIRNRATVGGNLAQHSRCWYYRHRDVRCRKKGGTRCYARLGENKFHALFTGCLCVSPCVSNLAVALAALDARVVVLRGGRTGALSVAQLYADAWRRPTDHNSLGPSDLIVRVEVPTPEGGRSAYLQVSEKGDFDWALVSCAAAARVGADGRLTGPRIVLGAVAPTPWQVEAADRCLEGRIPDADSAARAADLLLRDAVPLPQNGYKLPIARALVRRALAALV